MNNKSTCLSLLIAGTIVCICITALVMIFYYELSKSTLVSTHLGRIEGIMANRLGKKVRCYYGIPYAKPPIGRLRFSKPKSATRWKGVLKAQTMPSICWQNHHKETDERILKVINLVPEWKLILDTDVSEDCLYLNIFAPEVDIKTLKSNLTVMVWIHGGGFRSGSSALYDGATIAAWSNVIVVSINYRLGIFGFLSGDKRIPGNIGLHDQVMALQWVKENIWAFGGNASNVVIFGQSAGGISCGYHLISRKSENLFKRAILQSGNAVIPIALAGPEQQAQAALEVIKLANCPLNPRFNENMSSSNYSLINNFTISCLKRLNASKLFEIYHEVTDNIPFAFLPVEDDDFFDAHAYDLVKSGKFGPQKEILIGSNSVEGAYFSRMGPFREYWSSDRIPENFTKSFVVEVLKKKGPESGRPFYQFIADFAFDGLKNENDSSEVWNRFIKLVGDAIFICPDWVFINAFSSIYGKKAYYYHFIPRPSYAPWSPKWAKGAIHGDEVPFVFGIPIMARQFYTFREIEFSKTVMSAWTQFAKTGNPSTIQYNNTWQSYTQEVPIYMELDVDRSALKQGFPGFKCDQYYDKFYNHAKDYVRSGGKLHS